MSSETEPIIRANGLGKKYLLRHQSRPRYETLRDMLAGNAKRLLQKATAPKREEFWALRDISFEVKPGDKLGIIGRNGAGKTTLLKILSRITEPSEGRAEIRGRVASLLEVGTGFHPELTGRENIFLNGAILGMRRAEIRRKFDEIVAFAEVEKFLDTPVKRYSSGMYVRLAFSVAAHLEPEILLIDEVLAVGDAEFQKKCLGKMGDVAKQGRTILFISHNMGAIANLCSHAIWLDKGKMAFSGNSHEAISKYVSQGAKSQGEMAWTDIESSPGNENVHIKAVRIRSAGEVSANVLIDKEIEIEIDYWNLKQGQPLYVGIQLRDKLNSIVFVSVNWPSANLLKDEWAGKPRPKGLYRSTCKIPANFLNNEGYSVDVGIANTRDEWQDIQGNGVIFFAVHETGEMKKEYSKGWAGVVRPKFAWATSLLDEDKL
ncbi:MAG: ABC transporter ATP-binding protein [Acidobacteria bacterium]|jgi:lipopolysaccharide transport system ATP-binding protein|nr:ABC transporter ATP-binding protein [Acidobacteriota bacterium]